MACLALELVMGSSGMLPTQDIDHCLIHDMEHGQKIQYKHPEYRNGDLVLGLIVQNLSTQ
jgi:hypothetical protein